MSEELKEKQSRLSYKDMLTNMLIVFVNRRIKESKDIEAKVATLDEEKVKNLHKKIVGFVIQKAKSLAELQGTDYLGVEDEIVVNWINTFFDEFEENMKEPEKKVVTKAPITKSSKTKTAVSPAKEENKTYDIEDGFFGIEVKIDKKTPLSKEEFIKKLQTENEGKEVIFNWTNTTVEVTIKEKKEELQEEPEVEEITTGEPEVEEEEIENGEPEEEEAEEEVEDEVEEEEGFF